MTHRMTNRWILRAAAVALRLSTIALCAGAIGFIRISHARRVSVGEWSERRCSVYRSTYPGAADPCSDAPRGPTVATISTVRADIKEARAALARGDDQSAARDLARALDRANTVEKQSSLVATAVAAVEVSEILDVIDASPAVAHRPELRAALVRTTLATAQRPLEAERLRAARATLAAAAPKTALVTWGATDARIADEIEREDAALLSMQRAARAGNRAACERAAVGPEIVGGHCAMLIRTVATARRLDRARR
jgi:hypothetical protein